jgi:hypothetical protein
MVLRSQQTHSVAVRPLTAQFSRARYAAPTFSIIVTNGGSRDLPFSSANVYAYCGQSPIPIVDVSTLGDPTVPAIDPLGQSFRNSSEQVVREALTPLSIRPGMVGGGRVILDPADIAADVPLQIVVTVGGETHTFLFAVTR